jgi:hypothetical protein
MVSRVLLARLVGVAVLLGSPLLALAQQAYPQYYEPTPAVRRPYAPPPGFGATVTLGGGFMNFTGQAARDATTAGGAWGLRMVWGTRTFVGVEAAYVGSLNGVSALGLDDNALLLGNGVEGALRLNLPVIYNGALVEPFVIGGVGWTRFDVINDDFNTSSLTQTDHILTVPAGAGLTTVVRGVLLDARFTYRFAFNENLFGTNDLGNWIVSANIGSEF